MQNDPHHIRILLIGFIDNRLSPHEMEELLDFIQKDPESSTRLINSGEIKDLLRVKAMSKDPNERWDVSAQISSRMRERLMSAIDGTDVAPEHPVYKMKPRWPIRRIAVAAAALIIIFGSWYALNRKSTTSDKTNIALAKTNDVSPGGNKAVLTLGNGSTIILDSAHNGTIAQQGQTNIIKTDSGKLFYTLNPALRGAGAQRPTPNAERSALNDQRSTINDPRFTTNTLTTPRGGQFQLTLSDGTKVWLNATSSITYPTAFSGDERKVTITGEAYFEVMHNAAKPFIVQAAGQEIKVLGTHFNVNAYPDENGVKTTLLQGSVKVTTQKTNQSVIIAPGQQADLNGDRLSLIKNVNLDEITAWKEGSFHFESADLKTILRQFSRWYDVDVVYEGVPTERKFFGIVKRSNSLRRVLEMLKDNNIEYRIEGNKLIVKSS